MAFIIIGKDMNMFFFPNQCSYVVGNSPSALTWVPICIKYLLDDDFRYYG